MRARAEQRWEVALIPALVAVLMLSGCSGEPADLVSVPPGARISVSGRCPGDIAGARGVVAGTRDRTALLPPSLRVSGALVCEYSSRLGPSRDRARLVRQVSLPAEPGQQLAAAARAIAIVRMPDRVTCPGDAGTTTVVSFARAAGGGPVDLWWSTTGCQSIDNGRVSTTQVSNDSFGRFQAVFGRLTAPARSGSSAPSVFPPAKPALSALLDMACQDTLAAWDVGELHGRTVGGRGYGSTGGTTRTPAQCPAIPTTATRR